MLLIRRYTSTRMQTGFLSRQRASTWRIGTSRASPAATESALATIRRSRGARRLRKKPSHMRALAFYSMCASYKSLVSSAISLSMCAYVCALLAFTPSLLRRFCLSLRIHCVSVCVCVRVSLMSRSLRRATPRVQSRRTFASRRSPLERVLTRRFFLYFLTVFYSTFPFDLWLSCAYTAAVLPFCFLFIIIFLFPLYC